ncbi:MAG: Uma2 family endonuclease [Acidobacteria bacterium]|nr:Uma2 family endonuclease [Acidobacteriota bacterium]
MAIRVPRLSVEEYLALDRQAELKSEYHDGEMFPMEAVSWEHSLISPRVLGALDVQLRGTACRVSTDIRVRVTRTKYVYPDMAVVCGKPELTDEEHDTITNPKLIVEVLSPSTMNYDMGEKFRLYRGLQSFEEYVLVYQFEARVEVVHKLADGSWLMRTYSGLETRVPLESINAELLLSDIYEGIEFAA